jgi:hypothetical protein
MLLNKRVKYIRKEKLKACPICKGPIKEKWTKENGFEDIPCPIHGDEYLKHKVETDWFEEYQGVVTLHQFLKDSGEFGSTYAVVEFEDGHFGTVNIYEIESLGNEEPFDTERFNESCQIIEGEFKKLKV